SVRACCLLADSAHLASPTTGHAQLGSRLLRIPRCRYRERERGPKEDMNFRNDPFFEEVAPPPVSLFPDMGLGGSSATRRQHHHHHDRSLALSPFGGMGMGPMMPFGPSPFSMMSGMMQNMDNMMRNMQSQAAAGGHSYSSSTTVMHYSSDGRGGQPHTYQATSSTRQGPGGVKETKKAVKDSQSGVQKMAVGHHIGDRAHVIERQVNAKTGEKAQNQEFINLDECMFTSSLFLCPISFPLLSLPPSLCTPVSPILTPFPTSLSLSLPVFFPLNTLFPSSLSLPFSFTKNCICGCYTITLPSLLNHPMGHGCPYISFLNFYCPALILFCPYIS
ncbi:Myeloid leukemia factor 1, partial [Geodia barretti]